MHLSHLPSSISLIDTHCHLDFSYEDTLSTKERILKAQAEGVRTLITISTTRESFSKAQMISKKHPSVFFTVGIHPHDSKTLDRAVLKEMETFTQDPKCCAIGEIGLDDYYHHSDLETQKKALKLQLDLAIKLKKPVSIHTRDAESDIFPFLKDYASQTTCNPIGVIHCFTGTEAFAKKVLDLGFLISFSGILTFKKTTTLRALAQTIPIEKTLVETDAPFLAPEPFRGKKCQPYMVKWTANKLAQIKELPLEKIAQITTENAKKLFHLA